MSDAEPEAVRRRAGRTERRAQSPYVGAERADITRDTLRKIESGSSNVSFNSVAQVLRALGILDQTIDAVDPLNSDIGRLRAGRLTRKRAR